MVDARRARRGEALARAGETSPAEPELVGSGIDADDVVSSFIEQVGSRVQSVRKSQRMSRRELSERSTVSPRYLAKLEGGDGNISIGLLKRIALALSEPIESLLSEVDEAQRMIPLYRQADSATRTRVMQLLDSQHKHLEKGQRLCLVGLRGAGKSTLGARVGAEHHAPFIELNSEIESTAGISIGEIIELYGQEGYRQFESDMISQIIETYPRAVVAVAGGIVSDAEAFHQVLSRFHTVWVKASEDEHMDRVRAQGDLRPMEGNPQAMSQLRQILTAREALYAKADHLLDTEGKSVEASHQELSELIRHHSILDERAA